MVRIGDPFAVLNKFGFMTYLGGVHVTPRTRNSAQPLSCGKTNRIIEIRRQRKFVPLPCNEIRLNRRGGCPTLKFSPECEVAHTSPPKLFRRVTQIRARRRGDDGRWPPKTNLSCVKSAKKGMLPGARKIGISAMERQRIRPLPRQGLHGHLQQLRRKILRSGIGEDDEAFFQREYDKLP